MIRDAISFTSNLFTEFTKRCASFIVHQGHRFRYFLFSLTLALLFFAFIYVSVQQPYESNSPVYSAHSTEWNGHSLAYAFLSSTYATKIITSSFESLNSFGSGSTLLILSPQKPFSNLEKNEIREYVNRGGTIIIADAYGPGANLLEEFPARFGNATLVDYASSTKRDDLPVIPFKVKRSTGFVFMRFPTIVKNYPENASILTQTSAHSYLDLNANRAIDPKDIRGPFATAVEFRKGNGTVIAISDGNVFTNEMIVKGDNAAFLKAILDSYGKNLVILDETHYSGDLSNDAYLISIFFEKMRETEFMTIIFVAAFLFLMLAYRSMTQTEKKKVEAQADLKCHTYKCLVEDITSNAKLRPEPYTWMVLMQYVRFREKLVSKLDAFKREIDNEKLARGIYKKYGIEYFKLKELLDTCAEVEGSRLNIGSFSEAKRITGVMREILSEVEKKKVV